VESKHGSFETAEVLRWALTMKISGGAYLSYKRNKKFFVLKNWRIETNGWNGRFLK